MASVGDSLRQARTSQGLSQTDLAAKLGIRQRQISDLERAANDPRLSTIQNVARALDLEVMLVPRHLITVIEGMQRSAAPTAAARERAMYSLESEEDAEDGEREIE